MALTIRAADLDEDRDLLIETLRRHLTPLSDAARFEWLYRSNPHGPAVTWIAVDDARDETIGMASAFPRRAVRDGKVERCWILADFCIHAAYRALGPAVQLNRACLSGLQDGGIAFCYDFPSEGMMAVYRRLGIGPFAPMIRFAKVLRWGRKLRRAVKVPGLRVGATILGGMVDRAAARPPDPPPGTHLALEAGDCGGAFDELDRATAPRFRLHMERSSAFMNWKYRANPATRYEILTARRGGALQGYAVFTRSGEEARLVDLVAREDGTSALLLDATISHLRTGDAMTLSVPVLSAHPLIPQLMRHGFRARETSPVILYRRPGQEPMEPLASGDWPLMHGDRDG